MSQILKKKWSLLLNLIISLSLGLAPISQYAFASPPKKSDMPIDQISKDLVKAYKRLSSDRLNFVKLSLLATTDQDWKKAKPRLQLGLAKNLTARGDRIYLNGKELFRLKKTKQGIKIIKGKKSFLYDIHKSLNQNLDQAESLLKKTKQASFNWILPQAHAQPYIEPTKETTGALMVIGSILAGIFLTASGVGELALVIAIIGSILGVSVAFGDSGISIDPESIKCGAKPFAQARIKNIVTGKPLYDLKIEKTKNKFVYRSKGIEKKSNLTWTLKKNLLGSWKTKHPTSAQPDLGPVLGGLYEYCKKPKAKRKKELDKIRRLASEIEVISEQGATTNQRYTPKPAVQ